MLVKYILLYQPVMWFILVQTCLKNILAQNIHLLSLLILYRILAIGANESINFLLFLLKVHEGLDSKYSFKKKNPVIIAITRFH